MKKLIFEIKDDSVAEQIFGLQSDVLTYSRLVLMHSIKLKHKLHSSRFNEKKSVQECQADFDKVLTDLSDKLSYLYDMVDLLKEMNNNSNDNFDLPV